MEFCVVANTDGFGSHCQHYTFGILYVEHHGNVAYISPETFFEHNYEKDPHYVKNMLEFINLHKYYQLPSDKQHVKKLLPTPEGLGVAYNYCNHNLNTLLDSESFARLKSRFMENKVNPYDSSFFNVAIHVRRPNSHDTRLDGADTPDSYYLNIMNIIRKEHDGSKPLKFHIYSQGDTSKFDCYRNDDVVFHLNESIQDTVNGLLFGDILVTSASSLSYVCGFYTNGKVYYKSFWHPPYKTWRRMD
jgi:hypothetical protein